MNDLGVFLTADMRPSKHAKASKILGMIGRTYTDRSREVLIPLYKSLVRPHLNIAVPYGHHIT